MEWLVLSLTFAGRSGSTARVGAWRRLKRLGAVTPRHGLWVLPRRPDCVEAAQWLSREVSHDGGEALVMTVTEFEGMTHGDLVALFHAAAAERYRPLLDRIAESASREGEVEASRAAAVLVSRLTEDLTEARRIDYFDAPEGREAATALETLRSQLSPRTTAPEVPARARADYVGRTWVTRPQPFVDRLACAWLVRRFIDADAVIRYAERPRRGEVAFDMPGGEFEHVGPLCTFEVMLRAFDIATRGIDAVADVVHEVDLHDGRSLRPETFGVEAVLRGWHAAPLEDKPMTDHSLESAGLLLFDGLHAHFSGQGPPVPR